MRVENHLLRLAWIGANEDHPAVAQAHVGDLHEIVVTPSSKTISWLQSN